jgi:hypothetical protein
MVPILAAWDGASGLAAAAVAGMVAVVLGYRWARVMGNEELDLLARAPVPGASRLAAVLDARSAR